MQTKTLVELVNQSQIITESLAESGGELTPEIEALIEQASIDLADKMDRYYFVMRDLEMKSAMAKARAEEWANLAKVYANSFDHLKDRVLHGLQAMDVNEIVGREVTFKRRLNPPKAIIDDESLLGPDHLKVETVFKVDKAKIAADLKAGKPVPGAHLEQGERLDVKPGNPLLKKGAS